MLPLFVVARALPVTAPRDVKALLEPPKLVGVIICALKSLPIITLSPARSNSKELGAVGKGFSLPTVAFDVER